MEVFLNSHFSGLRDRPCCWRSSMTHQTTFRCSSKVFVKIRMLSKYTTTTPLEIRSSKIPSIIIWKVAGLLVRPKNITSGSYSPQLVQKAAFHSSPFFIWTLLKPQQTLRLVKYLAPCTLLISLEMRGNRYLFLTVITFKAW